MKRNEDSADQNTSSRINKSRICYLYLSPHKDAARQVSKPCRAASFIR